jgi:hypothetical protein
MQQQFLKLTIAASAFWGIRNHLYIPWSGLLVEQQLYDIPVVDKNKKNCIFII